MLLLIGRADPHAYEDTSLLSSFCPAGSQATTHSLPLHCVPLQRLSSCSKPWNSSVTDVASQLTSTVKPGEAGASQPRPASDKF